ncbi:MAG: tetratricopeptide repeat protein [bacterium]|nr:tetratricopeptide repeat protein [bacterium]
MRALSCLIGLLLCGGWGLQGAEKPLLVSQPVRLVGDNLLALPLRALDERGNGLALVPTDLADLRVGGAPLDWWQLEFRPGLRGLAMTQGPGLTLRRNLEKLGGLKGLLAGLARDAHWLSLRQTHLQDFRGERAISIEVNRKDLPELLKRLGRSLLGRPGLDGIWSPRNPQPLLSASEDLLRPLRRSWASGEGVSLPPMHLAQPKSANDWSEVKSFELRGGLGQSPGDLVLLAARLPADHPLRSKLAASSQRLPQQDWMASGRSDAPQQWKVSDPALRSSLELWTRQLGLEGRRLALEVAHRPPPVAAAETLPSVALEAQGRAQPGKERLVFSRIGQVIYLDAELVSPQEPNYRYRPEQLELVFVDLGPFTQPPGRVRPLVRQALGQVQPDGVNYLLFPLNRELVQADRSLALQSGGRVWQFDLDLNSRDRTYLKALAGQAKDAWLEREQALGALIKRQDWKEAWTLAQPGVKAIESNSHQIPEPLAARWLLWSAQVLRELGEQERAQDLLRRLIQQYPLSPQRTEAWTALAAGALD